MEYTAEENQTVSYRQRDLLELLRKSNCDIREEDVLIILSYDLGKNNEKTEGFIVITKQELTVTEHGDITEILPLSSIREFSFHADVGCVVLEYRLKENEKLRILCRGTMEHQKEYGILAKQCNWYLEKGSLREEVDLDRDRVCPVCGTPYKRRSRVCMKCLDKKTMLKRMWELIPPYKWLLFIASLLFFATVLVNMAGPYLNKILVDSYVKNDEIRSLIESQGGRIFMKFLFVIFLVLVVYLMNWIISIVRNLLVMKVAAKMVVSLRSRVFDKIQMLSLSRLSKRTTGELIHRVVHDTQDIQNFINSQIPNVLGLMLQLLFICVAMAVYDWRLLLIFILPIPLCVVPMRFFIRMVRRIYGRQREAQAQSSTVLHDIFSGIRVVKAFGMEEKETQRYDQAASRERDISIRNETLHAIFFPFIRFSLTIGNFFLLYFTGTKILNGTMTIGEATMMTSYVSMVYGPLNWLTNFPNAVTRFFTSLARVFDILDEKPEMQDKENAKDFVIKGDITFENITFAYDDITEVLKDVSLEIRSGEMIGLVGKSGVGKSTLINLVMRLYDVTEGRILIDGVDIRDIPQHTLRSQIGVVLQETVLFPGTVYDNLRYAKPDATRKEIIESSKIAGAHPFILKLPDGYNTRIGEKGYTLSGGERQRVAIARALLRNPRILILDEATASLDTEVEKQIQDTLQKLVADRTTIAIAHRLSTLRNATKLVVLDQKSVAEVGSHEELLRQKGIYYRLVMAQRQMSKMPSKKG